jgi:glycosyltransferase involved in cell wall biosynthesis
MKIAIVHDYLNQFGGAERVVAALNEIWPNAPVFTSIYNRKALPDIFQKMDIRVSFMQKFPFIFKLFKYYLLFYPLAFENFNLDGYDVILSSSSAFAKGIKKRDNQLHICYCHSPMRFVWRYEDYVKKEAIPSALKKIMPIILKPLKKWDLGAVDNVDFFIANSSNVAKRIEKTYNRKSVIIYPPVETDIFRPSINQSDYFLLLSRLNSYKRIDIVIEAFRRLDLPLKVIGEGPCRKYLESVAGKNIEFLGRVNDRKMAKYLSCCRALIFPGEEDFGIVPLEAMSAGRPVIAYQAGGALETVVQGQTGLFFKEQNSDSLIKALDKFQFMGFDRKIIRAHAKKFDKENFKKKIEQFVEEKARSFGI